MKRFNNLYDNMCKLENIEKVFKEICRNTKNKSKGYRFREYKCLNITRIYDVLKERRYVHGPYNRFTIYEPKERHIVSQGMLDKAVNHLVARYILIPSIAKCLIDSNVASRLNKGTSAGLKIYREYVRKCNLKYKEYLKICLELIKKFLEKEKLVLNRKTRIYKNTNKFIYLGRKPNGRYARYRTIKRKIKKRAYLYQTNHLKLNGIASTMICYKSLN